MKHGLNTDGGGRQRWARQEPRPPAGKQSVFHPWLPTHSIAERGLGKTEPRDCRLRSMRTTGRGGGPLWCEGWRSGGAWQGQVPERAIGCEQCSLRFAYVRLGSRIGRKNVA